MEFPACKQINKQSNGEKTMKQIEVRGDRVHNLKNIDVNVPLNKIVGITGAFSAGKSSLVLGVLYAEGSRRYLESLSTYTRRRMTGPRGRAGAGGGSPVCTCRTQRNG